MEGDCPLVFLTCVFLSSLGFLSSCLPKKSLQRIKWKCSAVDTHPLLVMGSILLGQRVIVMGRVLRLPVWGLGLPRFSWGWWHMLGGSGAQRHPWMHSEFEANLKNRNEAVVEIAWLAELLPCKHRDLNPTPECMSKWQVLTTPTQGRQRQEDPCGVLAGHSRPIRDPV